jgi:8-oxo-dGTP diphosphatase
MDLPFHQLKSFGNVDRDPRMRVISVAYMSFVPFGAIQCSRKLGYDDVKLFSLEEAEDGMVFISRDPKSQTVVVKERELAFDHAEMVRTALKRLRGRIDYTDDAFAFLDRTSFTVYQLKSIYEAVKGKYLDAGNFRRDFKKKYEDTGRAEKTGETRGSGQGRPAPLYRIKQTEGEWT